jgi:hypothetical protein
VPCKNGNLRAPVEEWSFAAGEIRDTILEQGFSKRLNSFVQAFGEEELDACALLIPIHGFLPPEDPRVQSTIDAVCRGFGPETACSTATGQTTVWRDERGPLSSVRFGW